MRTTHRTPPTIARLRELYSYDPLTGILSWNQPTYNAVRKRGDSAGGIVGNGYLNAWVDRVPYGVHRIAYAIMTGIWPKAEIDHINGRRNDNRWVNLRLATRLQNAKNVSSRKQTKSGVRGVHPFGEKFFAYINYDGKRHHLGVFQTIEAATAARKTAEGKHFGEFARTE